ncbi:MAG: carboxypeptidase regulatory-like domain-containing protein, partial [Candidatus Heimdallarchaeota archaeon]|nr:carboxypeptidase regulatory-like domain-containing protein [Candidatus Heimdallarchaeota archaeon]
MTGIGLPGTAQGAGKYGSLTGCVRDSKTELALSGAQVTMSAGLETYNTETDKDGHYFFNSIPGGTQFPLTVSCPNYKEISTHFSIQPGTITHK